MGGLQLGASGHPARGRPPLGCPDTFMWPDTLQRLTGFYSSLVRVQASLARLTVVRAGSCSSLARAQARYARPTRSRAG
jgi:hypothetical protein